MPSIIQMMENCDLLVFAAPVYFDTMASDMKKMFERLMPTLGPVFEYRDKRTYHLPTSTKLPEAINILLCGNPERQCLESISKTLGRIIKNMQGKILGEFLFPSSHLAVTNPELLAGQIKALTKAGKEIVSSGRISRQTISAANREYIKDPEAIIDQMNQIFQELRNQNL